MSSLRITQNSMNRTQLAGLHASLSRLQQTQEQLASGKRLNRPSDNPVDTVSAMRLRAQQRQLEQFGDNISDGLGRLRAADDALTRTMPLLQRIRTLAVAAANGTTNSQQRQAMVEEVGQLREGVRQLANTQYGGRPIFAGTANVSHAFDATGAFKGNDLPVLRQITDTPGAAGQVNVAVAGQTAFGTSLADGTGSMARLQQAIATGDVAGIRAGIVDMDAVADGVLNAASTIGARTNRVESVQGLNGRQDDDVRLALSTVEEVDLLQAATDLSVHSNAYQAALSASAKLLAPSLMDFLR